jgi:hypothetical protein
LETATDGISIAACQEAAARIQYVLEWSATNADFKYTTIKAGFEVEVVPKTQLS